jgi:hypothetical protein
MTAQAHCKAISKPATTPVPPHLASALDEFARAASNPALAIVARVTHACNKNLPQVLAVKAPMPDHPLVAYAPFGV